MLNGLNSEKLNSLGMNSYNLIPINETQRYDSL